MKAETLPDRDNFPQAVRRVIGERVNYHCSNPQHRVGTTGPRSESDKSITLGVAAHITAAAPGGPRHDASLSPEERASASNGIWLCQNCAKLIDNDVTRFSSTTLRQWKAAAEQLALDNIGRDALFDRESVPPIAVVTMTAPRPDSADLRDMLSVAPPDDATVEMLMNGQTVTGSRCAAIGVGTNHGWDWEVMYLIQSEVGWITLASISFPSQKGHTPEVQYIPGYPGAILVNYVAGYGSGVMRKQSTLYRIGRDTAQGVLTFPTSFYVVGWGMPFDRHLSLNNSTFPESLADGAALHLAFNLAYDISAMEAGDAAGPLLHYAYNFDLVWNDAFDQFVPRTAGDDLSVLDAAWNENTEMFVTRCRDALLHLGATGNAAQRAFVAKHVPA